LARRSCGAEPLERNARLCGGDDGAWRTASVHFGSGCSVVAARARTIVDSTRGMTLMEGWITETRVNR